jgi:hypothetical protein
MPSAHVLISSTFLLKRSTHKGLPFQTLVDQEPASLLYAIAALWSSFWDPTYGALGYCRALGGSDVQQSRCKVPV